MSSILKKIIAITIVMATTPVVAAQYTLTELSPAIAGTSSSAFGINNSGQVVGSTNYISGTGATEWSNGNTTNLGIISNGDYSVAYSINDTGQVVGYSGNGGVPTLWANGSATNLGYFPNGGNDAVAYGINNSGQVVGYDTNGNPSNNITATEWSNGGAVNLTGIYGNNNINNSYSTAYAINNSGQIVGYTNNGNGNTATEWYNGIAVSLSANSIANAINNSGQVVGINGNFAVEWSSGVAMNLGAIAGDSFSMANGINDAMQIVGYSSFGSTGQVATLWSGGQIINLNNLIDPSLGFGLINATAINNSGQIVGNGISNTGLREGFLLTPVPTTPIPSAIWLVGSALAGLIGFGRRKLSGP